MSMSTLIECFKPSALLGLATANYLALRPLHVVPVWGEGGGRIGTSAPRVERGIRDTGAGPEGNAAVLRTVCARAKSHGLPWMAGGTGVRLVDA